MWLYSLRRCLNRIKYAKAINVELTHTLTPFCAFFLQFISRSIRYIVSPKSLNILLHRIEVLGLRNTISKVK